MMDMILHILFFFHLTDFTTNRFLKTFTNSVNSISKLLTRKVRQIRKIRNFISKETYKAKTNKKEQLFMLNQGQLQRGAVPWLNMY